MTSDSGSGAVAASFLSESNPSVFALLTGIPRRLAASSFLYRSRRGGSGANSVIEDAIAMEVWGANQQVMVRWIANESVLRTRFLKFPDNAHPLVGFLFGDIREQVLKDSTKNPSVPNVVMLRRVDDKIH